MAFTNNMSTYYGLSIFYSTLASVKMTRTHFNIIIAELYLLALSKIVVSYIVKYER